MKAQMSAIGGLSRNLVLDQRITACWPNPVLLWDHHVRRLLEDKRTRFARRETFRV
jgi:hypothetical protein